MLLNSVKKKSDEARTIPALSEVDPKNLLLDESARNTIENARNTLEIMRKEAPGQEMKLYLVTSEFHSPRSEYIFKNVLDSQNASEVALEAYPAPSGLADDISDDPKKPMVRDFKVVFWMCSQ